MDWTHISNILNDLIPRVPWYWILPALHMLLWISAVLHALLFKRDSRAALGWIAVSLVFPFFGPLLYYVFGVNRITTSAQQLSLHAPDRMIGYELGLTGPVTTTSVIPEDQSLRPFIAITDRVGSFPLTENNTITMLIDGRQAYAAMLKAIISAKDYIVLATYIFESDAVGRKFIDALADAVARGVKVRVLVDGAGELYSWPRAHRLMKRKGITVARFLPPQLIPPTLHVNLRNHRKIMVVDGACGFTGGMNIGGRHYVDTAKKTGTTDVHFQVSGPVLAQLCQVFIEDWRFTTNEALELPCQQFHCGSAYARCIRDGPNEDMDKITLTVISAISLANHSVILITPYFLPTAGIISSLQAAALRGVDVAVLLPEHSNLPYVDWACRNMLLELLQYGVNIYYQPAPFPHTKMLVIDDCYAQVGSANMDPRSLRLNFELNMEILNADVITKMLQYASERRQRSRLLPLQEIEGRSLPTRIRDAFFWLFTPYL